MEPAPITGYSHVQLNVRDVSVSERWYVTVLGLERLAADEAIGYVALRHRPSRVVLVLTAHPDDFDGVGAQTRLDHIAFGMPDRATLERWAERLAEAGIAHSGVVPELANFSLHLRDPDGIAIELAAPGP